MGGRIEVVTEPGQGSLFTAAFPRRVEAPQELSDDRTPAI
jgi:signal transduction histidine kinase